MRFDDKVSLKIILRPMVLKKTLPPPTLELKILKSKIIISSKIERFRNSRIIWNKWKWANLTKFVVSNLSDFVVLSPQKRQKRYFNSSKNNLKVANVCCPTWQCPISNTCGILKHHFVIKRNKHMKNTWYFESLKSSLKTLRVILLLHFFVNIYTKQGSLVQISKK